MGLLSSPAHINEVTLHGLAIHIPPDQKRIGKPEKLGQKGETLKKGGPTAAPDLAQGNEAAFPFVIETVHADNAVLRILPKKIGSDPLIFELYKLTLHSVGFDHPIEYDAKLKNAKPPGLIDAKGRIRAMAENKSCQHTSFRRLQISKCRPLCIQRHLRAAAAVFRGTIQGSPAKHRSERNNGHARF